MTLILDGCIAKDYPFRVANVGENIKRLRSARGMTQGDLAARLGVKQSTVSNWETNRRGLPESPTLFRLAKALGCSIEELLAGVDPDYDSSRLLSSVQYLNTATQQRVFGSRLLQALEQGLEFPLKPIQRTAAMNVLKRALAAADGAMQELRTPTPDLAAVSERVKVSQELLAGSAWLDEHIPLGWPQSDSQAIPQRESIPHSDVEDGFVDVAGFTPNDIPVLAEGEASPNGSLFWSDEGVLKSDVEDRISRPRDVTDPRAYGVRVRGDSMLPMFRPGMTLIVSPNIPVSDGDEVYVQLLSGERLIKIARRVSDGWLLESANPAYEPRFVQKSEVGAIHPVIYARRKRTPRVNSQGG